MKSNFIKLLKVAHILRKKEEQLEVFFDTNECDFLGNQIVDIIDTALDILGFPKDTSVKYDRTHPNYYCRDYEYDLLFDYIYGNCYETASKVYDDLIEYRQKEGTTISFDIKIEGEDFFD